MATISIPFLKARRSPAGGTKQVATFLGWTPGVRTLLAGRVLPCGCLSGVYETNTGERVEILDGVGPACARRNHCLDVILDPSMDVD
jgi:hypothetical protein